MVIEERNAKSQTLYDLGKNDAEIARELKCCTETIRIWRKRNNYPLNFSYKDHEKIKPEKLKYLVDEGLNDREISEILGVSSDGVYASRIRNGFLRENYNLSKLIEATPRQRSILIGTLLGDSCLHINKSGSLNPSFKCDHGIKQKEYCYYKYELLKSLGMKYDYRERKTPDKRTGKFYNCYSIQGKTNPYYKEIYDNMYIDGKKRITPYILNDFNEESLALMFMDDGYKTTNSIGIATNGFLKEDNELFINFLKNKFNLNFNIFKSNVIYLESCDFKKFISIIFPYLHSTMYYKIGLQII